MAFVEKEIEIDGPVQTAYNQWTQFEEFPRFMEGVEEVGQLDDTRLHWVATIGGQRREWYAKITEQVPDKRIAWRSEAGELNAGTVEFYPIESNRTRLVLRMEYDPDGFVEKAGDMLGVVTRQVDGDLKRFKEFIEERGHETGAWRGTIRQGSTS